MNSNFYHVTTRANASLILSGEGIKPHLGKNGRFTAWYGKREDVDWAIDHTQRKKCCPLEQIIVLSVFEDEGWFLALYAAWGYFTQRVFYPVAGVPAVDWLALKLGTRRSEIVPFEGEDLLHVQPINLDPWANALSTLPDRAIHPTSAMDTTRFGRTDATPTFLPEMQDAL